MTYFELIFIISLASLGVRAITDKDKILYICRRIFDDAADEIKDINQELKILANKIEYHTEARDTAGGPQTYKEHNDWLNTFKEEHKVRAPYLLSRLKWLGFVHYIGKPLVTCSTCMASVWTAILFPLLVGAFDSRIFVVALGVAFTNTLLWALTQLITKALK